MPTLNEMLVEPALKNLIKDIESGELKFESVKEDHFPGGFIKVYVVKDSSGCSKTHRFVSLPLNDIKQRKLDVIQTIVKAYTSTGIIDATAIASDMSLPVETIVGLQALH